MQASFMKAPDLRFPTVANIKTQRDRHTHTHTHNNKTYNEVSTEGQENNLDDAEL